MEVVIGEEVQDGTVMPDLVGPLRPPGQQVLDQPIDSMGGRPEASPSEFKTGSGYVENGDVVTAPLE